MFLTANSAILPFLVLGISFTAIILLGTCLGEAFFLICDFRFFIKSTIRKNCSPKHVPFKIIKAPEIPRTKSGKIVELAVRKIINGEKINNKEAIANPDSLDFFKNLSELNS